MTFGIVRVRRSGPWRCFIAALRASTPVASSSLPESIAKRETSIVRERPIAIDAEAEDVYRITVGPR